MEINTNSIFSDTYRYNSVVVAFFIVAWANQNKVSINLTKTQKLLYIAYGAHLVIGDNRLCNEHPQAWPYGPVFPTTRNQLSLVDIDSITLDNPILKDVRDDIYLRQLISFVFEGFGSKTAGQLTAWSHSDNSPWKLTTEEPCFKWGTEIPDLFIYNYFNSIINKTPLNGQ